MADKKIIAVMGATGAQGGGLVRAIQSDPSGGFVARAITRDVNSDKAKALKALGAEVVSGDIDDEASLKAAFSGAYGVYCVTFFWAHFSPEKEQQGATNMARAAKAAGVQHVIWSTLEDTRKLVPLSDNRMPTLQGKYKVPHFDAKGEINHVFTDLGLPVTFLMASFYWDNMYLFGLGGPANKDANDTYYVTLPIGSARMAGIAAEDIGGCAYGIFKKGSEFVGKTVGIAGEHLSGPEMAGKLASGLGIKCAYNEVSPDAFRAFGFPGAEDLGNMFQVYRDFEKEVLGARSVEGSRALNPKLQSFDQWLAKNKGMLKL